jgi:hypothetical protein
MTDLRRCFLGDFGAARDRENLGQRKKSMMVVPFILLVIAALVATVGLRRVSLWVWFVAFAATLFAFGQYPFDILNIAL